MPRSTPENPFSPSAPAIRLIRAVVGLSLRGASRRLVPGLLELVPQLLFLGASCFVVFAMFGNVGGRRVPAELLTQFCLVMCAVDCLGDALLFKGVAEYAGALRRKQCAHYQFAPGPLLLKIVCLRWDAPLLLLGTCFFMAGVVHSALVFDGAWWATALALSLGIVTHVVMTTGFFVIQAYFDPFLPVPMGNPAARLYTKPLHLLVSGGPALLVSAFLYPAYFISAFPSRLASVSSHSLRILFRDASLLCGAWGASLVAWCLLLTFVAKRSCARCS